MRLFTCAMVLWLSGLAAHVQAQVSESAVKAAFLHKFPAFVEWPQSAFSGPEAPFVIGVAGAEEVAAELERVAANRPVLNRRLVVRRLSEGDSPRGLHLAFFGRGDPSARPVLRQARELGVLTVTETERGLELGAAINFVTIDDRVAFEISLDAAERAGLRISSRMLALARRVVPKT